MLFKFNILQTINLYELYFEILPILSVIIYKIYNLHAKSLKLFEYIYEYNFLPIININYSIINIDFQNILKEIIKLIIN